MAEGTTFQTEALNISKPFFAECISANCKSYRQKIDVVLEGCSTVFSVKNGNWADPSTWSCGKIPTINDSQIVISTNNEVKIKYGDISVKQILVSGNLNIKETAKLIFVEWKLFESNGNLIFGQNAVLNLAGQ